VTINSLDETVKQIFDLLLEGNFFDIAAEILENPDCFSVVEGEKDGFNFKDSLNYKMLEACTRAESDGRSNILTSVAELFLKGDWFLKYDSYLVPEAELVNVESKEFGLFRNQSVGRSCLLAYGKKNEVLVITEDVIHR